MIGWIIWCGSSVFTTKAGYLVKLVGHFLHYIYCLIPVLKVLQCVDICMLQMADAISEAIIFIKEEKDPPWIQQKFISSEIGIIKFQIGSLTRWMM